MTIPRSRCFNRSLKYDDFDWVVESQVARDTEIFRPRKPHCQEKETALPVEGRRCTADVGSPFGAFWSDWLSGRTGVVAGVLLFVVALVGLWRQAPPISAIGLRPEATAVAAIDRTNDGLFAPGDFHWRLDTLPIENIRVGMRVPASNPQLTEADRAEQELSVDPEAWRTFKVRMDKDDGTGPLEITLLRSADWFVERLETTIVLAALAEMDESKATTTGNGSWPDRARWLRDWVSSEPLFQLTGFGLRAFDSGNLDYLPCAGNPLLGTLRQLGQRWEAKCVDRIDSEISRARLMQAVLGGQGVGAQIWLEMPELGAVGFATVLAVEPCPVVNDGPGRVVTATFKHASANVLDLSFSPTSDGELPANRSLSQDWERARVRVDSLSPPPKASSLTLGVTESHPFWSVDREDFVPAGELRLGEQVVAIDGQLFRLTSVIPRAGPEAVYNLEVAIDHVYYVGERGVLAHNSCNGALTRIWKSGSIKDFLLKGGKISVRFPKLSRQ